MRPLIADGGVFSAGFFGFKEGVDVTRVTAQGLFAENVTAVCECGFHLACVQVDRGCDDAEIGRSAVGEEVVHVGVDGDVFLADFGDARAGIRIGISAGCDFAVGVFVVEAVIQHAV